MKLFVSLGFVFVCAEMFFFKRNKLKEIIFDYDVIMTLGTSMTLTPRWHSIVSSLMFVCPVVSEELKYALTNKHPLDRIELYWRGTRDVKIFVR